MKWEYKASKKGTITEGVLEARTKKQAEKVLRTQGLYPLEVKKLHRGNLKGKKIDKEFIISYIEKQKTKIPDKEMGKLFDNLEVLVRSNLTLTDSLRIVRSNKNSKKMDLFLKEMEKDLNKGYTISHTINKYKFIPPIVSAMLKTGEEIGDLADAFKQVSVVYNQKDEIKGKIMKAMAYPVFLLLTVIVMVYFISVKVLPSLIEGMGDQIETNAVTDMFMVLSNVFQNYGVILLIGIVMVTILPWVIFKYNNPYGFDRFIIKIPLIGEIIKRRIEIAVLKNYSLLYSGGVDTIQILSMLNTVSRNLAYQENLEDISKGVKKGEPVSDNMSEMIYSPTAINIFKVSEATGNVSEPFAIVAQNTEKQLEDALASFVAVITPVAVIILAGLVLLLIIGVMLPIFSIYNT